MSGIILALDGHDGAGKTTLAGLLADRVGAHYVRPFAGRDGAALMLAYERDDHERLLQVGESAIANAVALAATGQPLVLDRGWLTVSTLVPSALFVAHWSVWVPTALLWCDLPTTIDRLKVRKDEVRESIEWHANFLALYQARRRLREGPVVRTDLFSTEECLAQLIEIFTSLRLRARP